MDDLHRLLFFPSFDQTRVAFMILAGLIYLQLEQKNTKYCAYIDED